MFEAWLNNSLNKTMADAVFMACDADKNNEVVGLITVKRKDLNVNIGLLAVAESHRRMGIGKICKRKLVYLSLLCILYNDLQIYIYVYIYVYILHLCAPNYVRVRLRHLCSC